MMALAPGKIQLIANYPNWKCIKKFTISELSDPKTVGEFFVSYSISLDNRLEKYLSQIVNMEKVKEIIASAPTAKMAGEVPALLQYIASPSVQQKTHALGKTPLQGKLIHTYVIRSLFKQNGLMGDYTGVEIPGLKRLMKKKKD